MIKRRIAALLLSCGCALSTLAGATFTDANAITATEAVQMLTSMQMISGYADGTFQPNKAVTRGEMAKMVYMLRLGTADASPYANVSTSFSDINGHWAAGYIKYCQINGILSGRTNTIFAPDDTVTGLEAAKMLLIVMGYSADKAGLTGANWDGATAGLASDAHLLNDVHNDLNSALSRQYAAQMIYNTLDAKCVSWSNDSQTYDYLMDNHRTYTVGERYLKLESSIGTLVNIQGDSIIIRQNSKDLAESTCQLTAFSGISYDYSSLLGHHVKVMTKDGKVNQVLGLYETDDGGTCLPVLQTHLEQSGSQLKYDGKKYDVASTISLYTDGEYTKALSSASDLINPQSPNQLILVDSDDNGDIDLVLTKTYTVAPVQTVSKKSIKVAGEEYKFDEATIDDGLDEDDYVIIAQNFFINRKEIKLAPKINATIDSVKGGPDPYAEYKIDGTWYTRAAENYQMNSVKGNDTVECIVVNDVVFYAKKTSSLTTTEFPNVALVMVTDDNIYGKQAKVGFMDGTVQTVIVSENSDVPFASLAANTVYEYSTNTKEEYEFTTLNTAEGYYNNYTAIDPGKNSVSKDKYAGIDIAPSAKVFLYSPTKRQMTAVSGNQYTRLFEENNSIISSGGGIAAFMQVADKDDKNTKDTVYLMFVSVSSLPGDLLEEDHYAYIVSDAQKSGASALSYTIWTGDQYISVQEKFDSSSNKSNKLEPEDRLRGMVIGYDDLDDDGQINNVSIYGEEGDGIYVRPLMNVSGNALTYEISNLTKTYTTDANTVYLYVDSDAAYADEIGQPTGTIRPAVSENGFYCANTMMIPNGPSGVSLLVVDVDNVLDVPALYHDVYQKKISNGKTKATISGDKTVKAGDTLTVNISDSKGASKTITLQNAVFADTRLATKTVSLEAKQKYTFSILADGNGDVNLTISE